MKILLALLLVMAPPAVLTAQSATIARIGPEPGTRNPEIKPANPMNGDREALAVGRRLFNWYNCSGCHGDHAGGGMGPSLRDEVWIYGGTDQQIFNSIYQGRTKGMPAWGTKIPAEQIWQIVAYIKSLRPPAEPDAPHR